MCLAWTSSKRPCRTRVPRDACHLGERLKKPRHNQALAGVEVSFCSCLLSGALQNLIHAACRSERATVCSECPCQQVSFIRGKFQLCARPSRKAYVFFHGISMRNLCFCVQRVRRCSVELAEEENEDEEGASQDASAHAAPADSPTTVAGAAAEAAAAARRERRARLRHEELVKKRSEERKMARASAASRGGALRGASQ